LLEATPPFAANTGLLGLGSIGLDLNREWTRIETANGSAYARPSARQAAKTQGEDRSRNSRKKAQKAQKEEKTE
jgi:hypothetical protein